MGKSCTNPPSETVSIASVHLVIMEKSPCRLGNLGPGSTAIHAAGTVWFPPGNYGTILCVLIVVDLLKPSDCNGFSRFFSLQKWI